jgi:hypothetical protein
MNNIKESIYDSLEDDPVARSCVDVIASSAYLLRGIELPHAHGDLETLQRETMFFLYRQNEAAARDILKRKFGDDADELLEYIAAGFACQTNDEISRKEIYAAASAIAKASEALNIDVVLAGLEGRGRITRLDITTAPRLVRSFTEGVHAIADEYRNDERTRIKNLFGDYV